MQNKLLNKNTFALSYWEYQSFLKGIDIAIIGSGIVGLTTAIFLKRKNQT